MKSSAEKFLNFDETAEKQTSIAWTWSDEANRTKQNNFLTWFLRRTNKKENNRKMILLPQNHGTFGFWCERKPLLRVIERNFIVIYDLLFTMLWFSRFVLSNASFALPVDCRWRARGKREEVKTLSRIHLAVVLFPSFIWFKHIFSFFPIVSVSYARTSNRTRSPAVRIVATGLMFHCSNSSTKPFTNIYYHYYLLLYKYVQLIPDPNSLWNDHRPGPSNTWTQCVIRWLGFLLRYGCVLISRKTISAMTAQKFDWKHSGRCKCPISRWKRVFPHFPNFCSFGPFFFNYP